MRHILYQEAAAELGKKIEHGPAYNAAVLAASKGVKIYVLTARSGRRAIERVHRFLDGLPFEVVEVYHVGRVTKDRQIELFLDKLRDHKVYLFEDDGSQLKRIEALRRSPAYKRAFEQNVTLVHIQYTSEPEEECWIRDFADTVIEGGVNLRAKTGGPANSINFETIELGLGHARGLFTYYAGQRLTSFRFFMIVMGALAAGLGSVLVADAEAVKAWRAWYIFGFGAAVALAGLVFFLLDLRNRELVSVAEDLLIETEKKLEYRGLKAAQTITKSNAMEKPGRTFGCVFSAVFWVTIAAGAAIMFFGLASPRG